LRGAKSLTWGKRNCPRNARNNPFSFVSSISRTKYFKFTSLPINRAFFACINFGEVNAFIEKEDFHLIEQKSVCVGIGNVQPEMVNKLLLFLHPLAPAIGANFRPDALTEIGRNRSVTERLRGTPAPGAFKIIA
jgi:hypothetical protein